MKEITKDNIIEYLKEHMPNVRWDCPVSIRMIGEGTQEEDGDGYVNYIYRVHTPSQAFVVKQGLPRSRVTEQAIGTYRNRLEYDSMRILYAIVPEYVPKPIFQDEENHVFVMEDVSELKIVRFALNKNKVFPKLGRQCGEYMAKTEFYTSEFYLSREEYRKLQCRFENTELRRIMEDGMFLDCFGCEMESSLGDNFKKFATQFGEDSRYRTELYKLRRNFMSHADALIHADLHTSNLLASREEMKVIDMEFTFVGPFGYDLGYLTGNLISQYCAACFKPFSTEEERKRFKAYLLATIKELFETYNMTFTKCWQKDAKDRYEGQEGLLGSVLEEVMLTAPGYASMVNWFRAASEIEYPDFLAIEDVNARRFATTLSLLIDWNIMFARYRYHSVDDLIDTILETEKIYQKKIEILK
ncbi:MAG: phosphotransferase [Eubacterium sp.]|nr:phosphotransferase [Eubacterium sp.]MDD7210268.1 phosphotransferase [Lachnospiraceae bacterium]MDY5496816.1 phosphotransferase [Anaerobutyricum sp.]